MNATLCHSSRNGTTRIFLNGMEIERVLKYSIIGKHTLQLTFDVDEIQHCTVPETAAKPNEASKKVTNKYSLLKAPVEKGEYGSQIVIVDDSTTLGKIDVCVLLDNGYSRIGWIYSDLSTEQLALGFVHDSEKRRYEAVTLLDKMKVAMQKICKRPK